MNDGAERKGCAMRCVKSAWHERTRRCIRQHSRRRKCESREKTGAREGEGWGRGMGRGGVQVKINAMRVCERQQQRLPPPLATRSHLHDTGTATAPIKHGGARGVRHAVRVHWTSLDAASLLLRHLTVRHFRDGYGRNVGGQISARKRWKFD